MKKAVLKVWVYDDKKKKEAMSTVSGLPGVVSTSIDMQNKKLTVMGYIDPATIVRKLRMLCHTEIVSVGPAKEPEKKKDEAKKGEPRKVGSDKQIRKYERHDVAKLVRYERHDEAKLVRHERHDVAKLVRHERHDVAKLVRHERHDVVKLVRHERHDVAKLVGPSKTHQPHMITHYYGTPARKP